MFPRLASFLFAIAAVAVPQEWSTADDHRHILEQLGIKSLRPGPSGNEKAANHANYDESLANPYPDYPETLRLKNGQPVATAETWWRQRRPEIVEDFEREVLGRVPANAPKITWTVTKTVDDHVGPFPVIARELTGHVDNSGFPAINVDIQMVVVTPAWTRQQRVPVVIMFGRPALPSAPVPEAFRRFAGLAGTDPSAQQQLIGAGWGYATLSPTSIQVDNGAGLTKGIIGLANGGKPRTPEDWGALRAWAWGASRALDYLETDSTVDAKRIGIEGVSRYGKAALSRAWATIEFASRCGTAGRSGQRRRGRRGVAQLRPLETELHRLERG